MASIAARSTYGNDQRSGGLTATAGRWASGVGQAAASASDRVGEAVQDLPGAGQAQRSVRAIADTVSDQDPLLLAAIGLAFGTALGAMLPGTRLEDETFGGVGKILRQAGEAQLEAGLEKVKEVAGHAVEAAQSKARGGRSPAHGRGSHRCGPALRRRRCGCRRGARHAARPRLGNAAVGRGGGPQPHQGDIGVAPRCLSNGGCAIGWQFRAPQPPQQGYRQIGRRSPQGIPPTGFRGDRVAPSSRRLRSAPEAAAD